MSDISDVIYEWHDFEEEIAFTNRFFLSNRLLNEIDGILNKIEYKFDVGYDLFRARLYERVNHRCNDDEYYLHLLCSNYAKLSRDLNPDKIDNDNVREMYKQCIQSDSWGYSAKYAGAPDISPSYGRVNPSYIRVLYLAEDAYTAVSEIRPYLNDNISVAKFRTTKQLNVINLTNEIMNDINSVIFKSDREMSIFVQLMLSFSKPTRYAEKDYLLPQFIAEYIKKKGYDGIRYMSSLSKKGINVSFFNPDSCSFVNSYVYTLNGIDLDISIEYPPHANFIENATSTKIK